MFIIEFSNVTVHIISMIFFRSFSNLIVLITFWGVFSTYPARNNFTFRIIGYPSHFLRWIISRSTIRSFQKIKIVFPLLYFLTCPNMIIVSFTLTCFLSFISSCCFIFWFAFSSLFCQKMRYRKATTRSCYFLHHLQIYCLLIYKKNAVHENNT